MNKSWYVVRTDEFPYSYWSGKGWGSSFYAYAESYTTKAKAESVATLIVAKDPSLVGIVKVIER